jgi:histidinol-phosphate aminotransferase
MVRGVIHIINPYDPGSFPEDIEKRYGVKSSDVISLSSNENPFLPPDNVKRAYNDSFKFINRYPHPVYRDLKERISDLINVDSENIAVGNGASEILKMICEVHLEAFDPVTIPIPGYTLYAILSMMMDASIRFIDFPEYQIDPEKLLEKRSKLIFICSPNNPTGNSVPESVMRKILRNTDAIVVVDEAYSDFSKTSHIKLIDEFDNLVVVKSFSKFFSLAGLRVGYAVGNQETIQSIEKVRLPFNISTISAKVAEACIESIDYFNEIRDYIIRERERISKKLEKMERLKVYPSDANFILFRIEGEDREIKERFERKGIILRNVTGLMGLDGTHFRVTVGKKEHNDMFLQILQDYLEHR